MSGIFAFRVLAAQRKYELTRTYSCMVPVIGHEVVRPRVVLMPDGILAVYPPYRWDGPSGPTLDTPSVMRASLAHDVLYGMIARGELPDNARKQVDQLFRRQLLDDKTWRLRSWWMYAAVRLFGGIAIWFSRRGAK